MIVVTILANGAVVAALYLGWHLNTFTALQLVTAGVVFALLEVLIFFPYRVWKSNKATIEALKASDSPAPDWSIRNLFDYINPDALASNTHDQIGMDILDRLATGRLTAWGRLAGKGRRMPLTEIETDFWHNAIFTYWFLTEINNDDVHAHSMDPLDTVRYRDVEVNKARAMQIWVK
jgi:hypothetical protein